MATPGRVKAITAELEKTAREYTEAKESFEQERVEFEAAREKFAGVRRLASEMLTSQDWHIWRQNHESVKFAAMPIGEAIIEVLRDYAYGAAVDFLTSSDNQDDQEFSPNLTTEKIVETLEAGGFEFRTTSPLREVNAALIKLDGVTKLELGGYQVANTGEILEMMRSFIAEEPVEEPEEKA